MLGVFVSFFSITGIVMSQFLSTNLPKGWMTFSETPPTTVCSPLPAMNGGTIQYTQSNQTVAMSVGTSAVLVCNTDFHLSASTTATCEPSGQWSTQQLGTCEPEPAQIKTGEQGFFCPNVTVTTGTVLYDLVYPRASRTLAILICPMGKMPNGTVISVCRTRTWTPSLGDCV